MQTFRHRVPLTVIGLFLMLGITTSKARAQNPTPFINEILPASTQAGTPGFTLTVDGAGFTSSAVVNWQVGKTTTSLVTTFVSVRQLTATIPATLIASAATATITVANPNTPPVLGTSNPLLFGVTAPTVGVALSRIDTSLSSSINPAVVAEADFNGDGKLDLAVVAQCGTDPRCSSGNVSILLGKGDGTFTANTPAGVGNLPRSMAVGDFDGDGNQDVAVANFGDNTVSILLGDGGGALNGKSTLRVGNSPIGIAAGDFNGDGKLDLVVVNSGDDDVSILLGKGDGTFPISSTLFAGTIPNAVTVGDFNGDGKLDLGVVINNCPGSTCPTGLVSILQGDGNGGFSLGATQNVGVNPESIVAGDFNGDGNLDLAVTNSNCTSDSCPSPGSVSILLGRGDGTFPPSGPEVSVGKDPDIGMGVGDFNGDGKLDLVVTNQNCVSLPCPSTGSVSVLLGNGDGTFSSGPTVGAQDAPDGMAVGDFTGDGRLGFAVVNDCGTDPSNCASGFSISTLLQQPFGTLSSTSLSFGNQIVGSSSSAQSVTVTAGASMAITSVAVSDGSATFSLVTTATSCPYGGGTLIAGGSCTVDVQFAPQATGSFTGAATLTDNSSGTTGSTQTIGLSGTGTAPVAGVSPPSLTFASQVAGTTSAAQTVTLSNTGSATLSISSVSTSGNFAAASHCGSSLATANSCTIGVTFTPHSTGPLSGTLTITDNSNGVAGSTQKVTLSGIGAAPFTITPAPASESVQRGILAAFILTLKSLDGFNGKVTLSCSGGPAGSSCVDLPQSVNLNGTAFALSGILFPKKTSPGTYIITFTGTSGSSTAQAAARFTVK